MCELCKHPIDVDNPVSDKSPNMCKGCEICNDMRIDAERRYNLEMLEYANNPDNFRECKRCESRIIPIIEPDWKDKCFSCFKTAMENGRPCKTVGCQNIIPEGSPTYKVVCIGCYKRGVRKVGYKLGDD